MHADNETSPLVGMGSAIRCKSQKVSRFDRSLRAARWRQDYKTERPHSALGIDLRPALTIVDNFARESLAIAVDEGMKGEQGVDVLDRIVAQRGAPNSIRVDNVLS